MNFRLVITVHRPLYLANLLCKLEGWTSVLDLLLQLYFRGVDWSNCELLFCNCNVRVRGNLPVSNTPHAASAQAMAAYSVSTLLAACTVALVLAATLCTAQDAATIVAESDAFDSALGSPSTAESKEPELDMLVATFVVGNADEIAFQRELMARQLDIVNATMEGSFSIKHIFIVCHGSNVIEAEDVVYMNCSEHYKHLYTKTFAYWTTISSLYDAKFYAKRDTDTYVCWVPVIRRLTRTAKAGVPIYAGGASFNSPVMKDPNHRWHDEFLAAVAPGQRTYWPYMQGAYYLLSKDLTDVLSMVQDQLQTFVNEDAMMGGWLLPYRKVTVDLKVDQSCSCSRKEIHIFHRCKSKMHHEWCSNKAFTDWCLRGLGE